MPTHCLRLPWFLFVGITLVIESGSADARPNIRAAFFADYPNAVGTQLDNLPSIQGHCGVCHYAFTGGGPRNPYGRAIQAVLGNYPNTNTGRQQAILSVQDLDSDVDGYTQLTEVTDVLDYVNTPTFPGLTPANVDSVSAVDLNDILGYLVPTTGLDTEAPSVTVTSPDGGESWEATAEHTVTWTATDNVGVTSVDVFYRDDEAAAWTKIAQGLDNSGSFSWFVHNTPTTSARVRVEARDAAGNVGGDDSDGLFTIAPFTGGIVPTTLRDFHQPGTQPFNGGTFVTHDVCADCHGGYDPAVEPARNWEGSMMSQAGRDPIFYACLAVAEQDAPSSGDLCLRCHTSFGWLSGRSNPTSGNALVPSDRDGVSCDLCHRLVDPIYQSGVSPTEDQEILQALADGDDPLGYSNGQYVIDPQARKRGPFTDPVTPHAFLYSPLHLSSDVCGTCHDVSNPVFTRTGEADYAPGPLDAKADTIASDVLMPLERTFSEWKNSDFNLQGGVYEPDFAGNKPDGIVSTCQDCHMHAVSGAGCNDPQAPVRDDLPLHDLTGGNAWLPLVVPQLYPSEVDASALTDGAARATSMLEKAATLDVSVEAAADSFQAVVTVTNRCGHKLPTGYPEGRRMWLNVVARDAGGQTVYESGAYDPATGILTHDADARIYEAKLGISPALASALGLSGGPTFHFALNDSIYKDNRIPPLGFTNAAFAAFGGTPVDPDHPGAPRYPDGQNWDAATYGLPSSARTVYTTLYYQTTSKEYVDFLHDENTTNTSGQTLYDAWSGNGRAAPIVMVSDTVAVEAIGVAEHGAGVSWALQPMRNPFGGGLEMQLVLPRLCDVQFEIYDLQGRRVRSIHAGLLAAGAHRLTWDGRDDQGRPTASGVFWARVKAGDRTLVRRVVRLQ